MAESGGPTAQSGIRYQNSIAALYLGRLLDTHERPAHERVVEVRAEAPEHVDDTTIRHADGGRTFIQAKEALQTSGDVWKKLWIDFQKQADASKLERHELVLVVSDRSADIGHLQEACERARGKENAREWMQSLNERQKSIIDKVRSALPTKTQKKTFELLSRVSVWHQPHDRIEIDQLNVWVPASSTSDELLFSTLRDLVGGNARVRATFRAPELLERLNADFSITIKSSTHWGLEAYIEAIASEYALISVPGTNVSGPIQEVFEWLPMYDRSNDSQQRDFEEEDPFWRDEVRTGEVRLHNYPRLGEQRVIVDASAGFGKTTMLHAIAHKMATDHVYVPAFIPLSDLAEKGVTVLDYLCDHLNHSYDVRIDWELLSETGRTTVLLDGFDELDPNSRTQTAESIAKFSGRFPNCPYLLTVRDNSAIPKSLGAPVYGIQRLDNELAIAIAKRYSKFGANVQPATLRSHMEHHPDLAHLLKIPLFLALALATLKPGDNLPSSRSELIENYLDILFDPKRHKTSTQGREAPDDLREAAEYLAYQGLESEGMGLNREFSKRQLRNEFNNQSSAAYIDHLIRYGVLKSSGARLSFAFPIIQEYLAAQYLVDNKPEEVAKRFAQITHRPWAQTVQFALELHPNAQDIIERQLKEPDDAFHSSLRLIGRCVVNGSHIPQELRAKIGDQLAEAWGDGGWNMSHTIGHLIADGFTTPLPKKAKDNLLHPWGLQNGGAEIVTQLRDPKLTLEVLEAFLKYDLSHRPYLHDWQEAVNEVSEQAWDMYLVRTCHQETTDEERDSLASLIRQLPASRITKGIWTQTARNHQHSPLIRIAAYRQICPEYEEEAWPLVSNIIDSWLALPDGETIPGWISAMRFYWHFQQAHDHFLSLCENKAVSQKKLKWLLEYSEENRLDALDEPDSATSAHTNVERLMVNPNVPEHIRFLCAIALAVTGDTNAMERAINLLPRQSAEHLGIWCWHVGHFSKSMALRGLETIKDKERTPKEMCAIISPLSVGLNYRLELSFSGSGVLSDEHRHPAAQDFVGWVSNSIEHIDFEPVDKLKVLSWAKQAGCEVDETEALTLLKTTYDTFVERDEDENDSDLSTAIHNGFYHFRAFIAETDMEFVWKIAERPSGNLCNYAINLIADKGDVDTIPRLLDLYAKSSDEFKRSTLLSALERLSSRYEKRIVREGDNLKEVGDV